MLVFFMASGDGRSSLKLTHAVRLHSDSRAVDSAE